MTLVGRLLEVSVPPVRDRRSDLPILLRHLLGAVAEETAARLIVSLRSLAFEPDAID
jgi:DNA-binding NtrC family response regulator